ncbi:transposase [Fodinibius halophilus]|uniref:Mutator family transposase n=1 Tax=Fodinibius halophilus TaxID=1736908 RepID=A0A6M1T9C7_9BACT|nr:transposase [Fodinibius halophilus]NGP90075.1 hypothetical protein [Fodinibius halophilus]
MFWPIETGWGESEAVWSEFIKGLKKRRLSGVRLFVSDNHPEIKVALRKHYSGVPWQRCQYHFRPNALDQVPKKREDQILEALERGWKRGNSYQQAKDKLEELVNELSDSLLDLANWLREQAPQTLTVFQVDLASHRRRVRTTNAVERLHQELKTADCGFLEPLKEQHADWITGRRYLRLDQLKKLQKNRNFSSKDPSEENNQTSNGLVTFTEKSCTGSNLVSVFISQGFVLYLRCIKPTLK